MKKSLTWSEEAKADLRRIRKEQALLILKALTRLASEGVGDVKSSPDDRLSKTGARHIVRSVWYEVEYVAERRIRSAN